jgi:hypothetical protein
MTLRVSASSILEAMKWCFLKRNLFFVFIYILLASSQHSTNANDDDNSAAVVGAGVDVVSSSTWMKNPENKVESSTIPAFNHETTASHKNKLRNKKGKKKAPNKADAGRFMSTPISNCTNESIADLSSSGSLSLIAIMVATTSYTEPFPSPSKLSLFTLMFPSLIRSLDCGFRYIVVIGYDDDDIYFSSEEGLQIVRTWFHSQVQMAMKNNGIPINLELVRVNNTIKKPGPVFIEIARRAYALGADFMYRVNDDTEFHGRWPKLYSETLMSLSKPYGVIGPRSTTTRNRILTHDFVHRTHMEIFDQTYYPVQLVDW